MSRQLRKPYAECIVEQIQGRVKGRKEENLINLNSRILKSD
jgi:hypothetical protein